MENPQNKRINEEESPDTESFPSHIFISGSFADARVLKGIREGLNTRPSERKDINPQNVIIQPGGYVPFTGLLQVPTEPALVLRVSPELQSLLTTIAEKTGATQQEIIERGIVMMGIATAAISEGLKVGVTDADQPVLTELTGL